MQTSMQHLLRPQVLTRVISQQAVPSDWLSYLFGVKGMGGKKGKNCLNEGHGRNGSYFIFDHLRKVGAGRAPGAAAHRTRHNPLGEVSFKYPRMHDSMEFNIERLNNFGKITDPHSRDRAGMVYIEHQTRALKELGHNWRRAMMVGALRDQLYIGRNGEDEWFDFDNLSGSTPVIQLEVGRRPNGNKGRLDMIGEGDIINASWSDATTDIPAQVGKINAAFQQLCGGHLAAVVITDEVWQNITRNRRVQELHGTAHRPFDELKRDMFTDEVAKSMDKVMAARLSFCPNVIWYITDEGLELGKPGSETYQKIVPDNNAVFIGHRPDDGTVAVYEGSELVRERDHMEKVNKVGMQCWFAGSSQPTRDTIFTLDNAIVVDHVPNSKAMGEVLF